MSAQEREFAKSQMPGNETGKSFKHDDCYRMSVSSMILVEITSNRSLGLRLWIVIKPTTVGGAQQEPRLNSNRDSSMLQTEVSRYNHHNNRSTSRQILLTSRL
jgi:hypothetical protein